MPAGIGSPFATIAAGIKDAFEAEFAPEQLTMRYDNLHGANGQKRVEVGIAPAEDVPNARNMVALESYVEVKFYDIYKDSRSPDTQVDPRKITEYAERFRRCLQNAGVRDVATSDVWYFDVMRIRYPNDPTGNKTRFVATIRAFGNNSGLVETTGS